MTWQWLGRLLDSFSQNHQSPQDTRHPERGDPFRCWPNRELPLRRGGAICGPIEARRQRAYLLNWPLAQMKGEPMQSSADFPTTRGAQLMQTLAKHFGHKIPVEIADDRAVISFDFGDALAETTEAGLRLQVTGKDAEAVRKLADVVDGHLLRFAHRDEPKPLEWTRPA